MTPSSRDTQRSAVYAAENQVARLFDRSGEFPVLEVAGSHVTLPVERHFGDIDAVQRYVDMVLALPWVRERWGAAASKSIGVRRRRGNAKAHYDQATATMAVPVDGVDARWALRELVVLHELAHHLGAAPDMADATDAANAAAATDPRHAAPDTGHGPAFTERFVSLVDGVMGPEAGFLLRVTMADQGVSIGLR